MAESWWSSTLFYIVRYSHSLWNVKVLFGQQSVCQNGNILQITVGNFRKFFSSLQFWPFMQFISLTAQSLRACTIFKIVLAVTSFTNYKIALTDYVVSRKKKGLLFKQGFWSYDNKILSEHIKCCLPNEALLETSKLCNCFLKKT